MNIKHCIAAAAIIGAAMGMASCSGRSKADDLASEREYFAFRSAPQAAFSLISPQGKVACLDSFAHCPSAVVDDRFTVSKGAYAAVYKLSGSKAAPIAGLDSVHDAGIYSQGVIPVADFEGHISMHNLSGKHLFVLRDSKGLEMQLCSDHYSNGLITARNAALKWGAFDTKGKVKVEFKYDALAPFSQGLALAARGDSAQRTYCAVDADGKEAFVLDRRKHTAFAAYAFRHGLVPAMKPDGRYAFLNTKGEEAFVCPAKVDSLLDYNKKYLAYREPGGLCGVMEMGTGKVVLRAQYASCQLLPWDEGKFLVQAKAGGDYTVVNAKGKTKLAIDCDNFDCVHPAKAADFEGFVACDAGKQWFFLDKKGRIVPAKASIYGLRYTPPYNFGGSYVRAYVKPDQDAQ